MDAASNARLKNLCAALKVPYNSTEPGPALALNVLSRMYLVPTIKSHSERNRTLNEIRGNLDTTFDPYSTYVGATASVAVMMQEFPEWYDFLNKSTRELVATYKDLERGKYWLGSLAIGTTAGGAAAAGIGEAIKSGVTTGEGRKNAAIKFGRRLTGQGPIVEELSKKAAPRIGAGRAGLFGVAIGVGATVLVAHASDRMEEIRSVLMDRFQKGDMTDTQFREVFGGMVDPSLVKKYWEM